MKLSALAISTAALAMALGGPVLAQVTMQPVPNPPEKAKAAVHKAKHHKKAETPKTDSKPAAAQ